MRARPAAPGPGASLRTRGPDVLIVAAVFAERAGIDTGSAVARKLAVTYSRGRREVRDE
jgi:hypothetical protein